MKMEIKTKRKKSTIGTWVERLNKTGSLDVNDNRSDAEKELIVLKKEVKYLRMENDILKQAALILGKK
jgi:transposase